MFRTSRRDYDIEIRGMVLHDDGGYIDRYGDVIKWYNKEGHVHREEGPAVILSDGRKWWYLNEKLYTFNDWCIKLNKPDEVKMMLRLQYA
jgi:hypothetical protein